MQAPVTFMEIFSNRNPGLYRLRSVHLRVQWSRIDSHGRNSFAYGSTKAYNRYELNGEWFGDEDTFKYVVKFKIFRNNSNGNVY